MKTHCTRLSAPPFNQILCTQLRRTGGGRGGNAPSKYLREGIPPPPGIIDIYFSTRHLKKKSILPVHVPPKKGQDKKKGSFLCKHEVNTMRHF